MRFVRFLVSPLCALGLGMLCLGKGEAEDLLYEKVGHPSFLSPHASPIAFHDGLVFVTNTPADTVDVIDGTSRKIVRRIDVGIDPVSIAVRPDGREIWVSNHISDTVSVIDSSPGSPTYLHVIATVQDLDLESRTTRFDEPVGIAFASNDKAYVALSSENQIAVVNVGTRQVEKRLKISAQDPRAIAVRGDRLYVIPFESNNKSQLSGGAKEDIDGDLVTFDAWEHSIHHNNVLSLGHVTDIVKHPRVPDRDLYVFDTKTDQLIRTVDTLGTLLYGMAVDSTGRVFIAQADARNDANGRAGTKQHGLAELENRPFLNQITSVKIGGELKFFDLELLPPKHPKPENAFATPFAIQVTADDSTLVVSAAGSDKVFTVDARIGDVLGQVAVDSVPRGIALDEASRQAWVLNAVANTVSVVNITDPTRLSVETTIPLEDPTHPAFKRGRIAFNTARASTTRSFSCASCHPDGHTDQLLWVLKTPIVTGGDQIMPRSTMPIRGLRDTAPFHWDGIPGDPYGGNNSAHIRGKVEPNSDPEVPESAARDLIDGGLANTMLMVGDETRNDEGKAGLLSAKERDDMAKFLLSVTYPPAPKRAYTNELSERAQDGFELFHILGNHEGRPKPNVCGNCHRMPFWVSTNSPDTGMDAPTWRGAQDRFLILPQGRLNIVGFDFYRHIAEAGNDERSMWRLSWRSKPRFDPVWDMVLEGSTGFSGSLGRQVTLSQNTASDLLLGDMLGALETSAAEASVVLQSEGVLSGKPIKMQFQGDNYVEISGEKRRFARSKLIELATAGKFVGTFTGRHGARADYDHPQPALWTLSSLHAQTGPQHFPVLHPGEKTMMIHGRHVREGASLIVNGRRVPGILSIGEEERLRISLERLPSPGLHFLQVQNPGGLFSNDFIFHVAENRQMAAEIHNSANPDALQDALHEAIERGNLAEARRLLNYGAPVNRQRSESGSTPLSDAVFRGNSAMVRLLVERKARVNAKNRDGNTPMHVAAFLGREEIVKFLLGKGASLETRNQRGETPPDTVTGAWTEDLARFYRVLSGLGANVNISNMPKQRESMARLLREARKP